MESAQEAPAHCSECGLPLTGRFCEGCGKDSARQTGGPKPTWAGWTAIVAAEPAYYQSLADRGILDPHVVRFPATAPQRRVRLTGSVVRIGRRSTSRGTNPEIDFSSDEEDPAVSHVHAELRARPDQSWAVVDCKSANGTSVNDASLAIDPGIEVPLQDGDRIYLGAWTVITIRKG